MHFLKLPLICISAKLVYHVWHAYHFNLLWSKLQFSCIKKGCIIVILWGWINTSNIYTYILHNWILYFANSPNERKGVLIRKLHKLLTFVLTICKLHFYYKMHFRFLKDTLHFPLTFSNGIYLCSGK